MGFESVCTIDITICPRCNDTAILHLGRVQAGLFGIGVGRARWAIVCGTCEGTAEVSEHEAAKLKSECSAHPSVDVASIIWQRLDQFAADHAERIWTSGSDEEDEGAISAELEEIGAAGGIAEHMMVQFYDASAELRSQLARAYPPEHVEWVALRHMRAIVRSCHRDFPQARGE